MVAWLRSRWLPVQVPVDRVHRSSVDIVLLTVVFMLLSLGLLSIYSGSAMDSYWESEGRSGTSYLTNQAVCIAMGLALMVFTSRLDYGYYWRLRVPIVLSSLLGLVAVWIPYVGITRNYSTRWVNLVAFQFQPAEWAKIAVCIYLAYSITRRGEQIRNWWQSFGVHLCVIAIYVALLMLQPDMGSSVLLSALMVTMLFLGGAGWSVVASMGLLGFVLLVVGVSMGGYRSARVQAWLDPWAHADGVAYQLVNSLVALASGGADGVGLGQGRGRLGYIPELHTDFIASGIGEEFGFLGMGALVLLYLMFLWRGVHIALRARDRFGYLLAMGLTFVVVFQAAMNLGVVTGLLPTKGLTLPFVSYGRSSLMMLMMGVGILLNISQSNDDVRSQLHRERKASIAAASRIERAQRVDERRRSRARRNVGDTVIPEDP
jgi:cell division protein FtsW